MGKMGTVNRFSELIRDWSDEYLPTMRGDSPNTVKAYKGAWNLMIDFLYTEKNISADKITFSMLNMDLLMEFLQWIKQARGCKDSTRNSRLAAIAEFADYAHNRDFDAAVCFYTEVKKIPYIKLADAIERFAMSKEETQIMLSLPSIKDQYGYRDRCILTFLYASACRGQELCDLKVRDVKFTTTGKASILLHGKGGKTRRIRISPEATAILRTYMRRRGIENQGDQYVFISQRNPQMTVACVEHIVEKYYKKAKEKYSTLYVQPVTPHVFRHTAATHMLEAGVPLMVISRFLGHAEITTTLVSMQKCQKHQ